MVQHRASNLGGYSLASMSPNFTNYDSGLKRPGTMPVAICGMGMRLPGGIRDSNALFDFLLNKRDARGPVPPDRFNIDGFYNPHGKHGCLPIHEGYWLHDVDLTHFDTSMFSMKRAEIENLDPQQRLLLEVVRETFESAAETDWRGKNIGCYTGSFGEEWSNLHAKDVQNRSFSVYAGYMDLMQANRISYEYDLRGPSMTLRAGCSAGGLGVHLAFQSIQLGECSSAIVAATNIIISPETTMMMSDGGALSPDASSKTFDASANGYVRAEGVNCLYLKRLDEAIRDGNPIRALIRGTSSNAGGKTTGLTVPNMDAQEALIRAAYRNACLEDPAMTAMVECHGTGTAVGDATEAGAIARIFGRNGVLIGGVKPNLGHSEGPAGITSIIKAVVELEHRLILPNIKFHNPNPKIPWEEARLMVPTEPTTWPEGRLERISVNSYGIGGSNVHIVLDSAASFGLSTSKSVSNPIPQPELLMLSAGHPESLRAMQQNNQDYAVNYPRKLRDLAYTLSHRRERLPIRGFSITNGTNNGTIHSPPSIGQSRKNIAFVFTGQGAQWAQMGKELLETCSDVLQDIRQMDDILQRQINPPKWTLEKELLKPVETSRMSEAEIAQPICTALQVALCNHLRRWNISPVATVGHSSGEIAAAYAAGCFSMRSAILLAYYRGVASKAQTLSGAMAAVGLGYDEVARLLKPGVVIACENSPASVTLSGDADALKIILAAIDKQYPQAFQRLLKVNKAYHSHHMQEVGQLYDILIGDTLKTEAPKVRFFSTVTTQQLYRAEDFEAHYWRQNLENPVWFYQGFSNLLQSDSGKDAIVLEIGPHSALAGPIKQIYQKLNASNPYVSVLTRCSNGLVDFLSCVGELFRHGADVRYPLPRIRPKALHDLPLYPWHHADSWWSESRPMKASRFQRFPHHDILGARTIESSDLEPIWRNILHVGNVSWIRDHCVGSDIVFPAAGYIAIAGHAVSQMTGLEDFTVRDVSFKTAMILDEAEPVEIITRLQPHRLTNSLDSGSFEFSIQSYNGKNWTQHCTGLVAGGRHSSGPPETAMTSYSRVVDSRRWYRAMARVGLRYGPRFVGLNEITAGVSSSAASTFIENTKEGTESPYTLHPTTIDYILQSSLVATNRGEPCLLQNAALPSFIEQMYVGVCPSGESIHINTLAHDQSTEARGMSGETLVFSLQGLEFTSLESTEGEEEQGHETAQLVWKPHLDFVDPTTLIKPAHEDELLSANALIERMFLLCIIDAMEDIKEIPPAHPHLTVYRDWMSKQLAKACDKDYPLVPDAKDLFSLPPKERKETIQALLGSHTEGTMTPGSRILFRCYSHLSSIFKGDTEPLELMRRDGLLGKFYDCLQDKHDYATFLQLLGHLRPRMNVLEIGAGTGGLTAKILPFLQQEDGEELYQEYTYTDISSGFFIDARERFHDCSRIRYSVLDISKDPLQQGFTVGQYDLIIASNILHATPYLSETLGNVKTLLKSDGRLLLQELCPVSNWINFIFGLFSGWWLGKDDGRADEPYVSPAEWDARLRDAGFAGIEASALDADYPHQLNAMMVAKPAPPVLETQTVTLLCIDPSHPTVESILQHLSSVGCKVDVVKWGQQLRASQNILFLLDIEQPWFDTINEENLAAFLRIIKEHSTSKFLWVTHSAQIKPQDPRFAQILGMARTLRSELGISFATLEMQDFGPSSQNAISEVLRKIQDRTTDNATSDFDADQEFAWADGAVHVGRMHWLSVPKSLEQVAAGTTSAATLDIGRPGLLNTLRWVAQPTKALLQDEVRIKTMSVSMNFRELLVAMGVVPKPEGQGMVGTDSAGIITAIGSNVKNVSIGDRVMAISVESSSYATELQVSSRFCTRIPDDCSFQDASTLPTVYLTILRTLREKANLRRGQTVLIHSAAGGVGIAAIRYAQSVAATIYATVSSPEKVAFLVNELGIAKENIFYSRDNSFLDDVMRATHGRGVDVVLNSLSGEQLHASWKCVAPGGSLIEIGKRDLLGRGQLAMNPFLANRSYIGVDVATLPLIQPEWVEENMSVIVDLYEQGVIKPIRPVTSFPAKAIEDAFRHLQKGQHIGKLLIDFSDCPDLPLASSKPKVKFRTDRAYLLVGGMRGIGASIATWMVSNGASHMVFLSRSAGEREEDKALMRQLSDMGCQVWTFAGDVSDLETVQRVVSSVPVPFAGVLQLAMVLADTGTMDMDFERWNAAVKPKVAGTWNLHKALPSDLDFLIMASSLSGIFGNYGQANYAAANTFLDAFAQFRHSKGLAASTVDLGVVEDIGWVSQNASIHRQVVQQMSISISVDSLLECLHLAILRSSPSKALQEQPLSGFRAHNQLLHGILSRSGVSKEHVMWKRDPRTAQSRIHHEKGGTAPEAGETKGSGLKGFLAAVQDNPEILNDESTVEVVATEIARQVTIYTMRDVDQEMDLSLSLQNFGLDSLVSIELRNWWKQVFGAEVTVLQLMNSGSLMGLGQKAVEQLKQKHLKP